MTVTFRWLAHSDVQEIGHDLGVLDIGTLEHSLVARARFADALQKKACLEQHIQPLTEGACETRRLEHRHPLRGLWWRGAEEPFFDVPLKTAEVVADLDGIRNANNLVLVASPQPMSSPERPCTWGSMSKKAGVLRWSR